MGLFKSASNAGRARPGPPRSNIRGNISGPIPIPDDEFPMRNPGSSAAQEGPPTKQLDPETEQDSAAASTRSAVNGTHENKTDSVAQSGPSQASTSSTHARRRTNRSSIVRYSTLSDVADSASPSRKKSSFRAAIGKLFKKRNKKRSSRSTSESEPRDIPPVDHHRSDPVVGERDLTDSETEPKRSASLPVTEFNKALRSHSIGPDDYMAIHSARNSLQSDSVFLRRRAATTSSGPIVTKSRDEDTDLGLSPRPASAQGHDTADEYDPEAIGRAVSVDYIMSRRRSRSLSQLPDVAEGHGLVRKRSDEIRYWRASQSPGGLLSPDLSVSNREEPVTIEPTGPTEQMAETPAESEPVSSPEPFNFGSMNTMRITQAVTLEDRVATLEVQNQKLERLVSKLFQVVPGIDRYSTVGNLAPPTAYATTSYPIVDTSIRQGVSADVDPLSPSYSVSEQSNMSFEDEKTFIGSIHPSTRGAPRPISNVTVRGATSLPALPRDGPNCFPSENYNTLKTLLDAERAARHALEIRVTQLAQIVHTMSRSTHKLQVNASPGAEMPISTFEDDDDDDEEPPSASIDDSSEAFKTPREERPEQDYDDFGDDDGDDGSRKRAARTLSLGQLTLGKPKHPQKPGAGVDL